MRYVIAGYVFVLGLLFLYAVQLAWRRQRLARTVARVEAVTGTPVARPAEFAPVVPEVPAAPVAEAAPGVPSLPGAPASATTPSGTRSGGEPS